MPCTAVNTVIALVGSGVFGIGIGIQISMPVGLLVAAVLFGLSMVTIYLRGYLVPGTPELTKRYFPVWLLELFGKAPDVPEVEDPVTDIEPEEELLGAGALEECDNGEDLCLTDSFRESWYTEIDRVEQQESRRRRLLDLFGLDEADVRFKEYGPAFQALVDGSSVGKWESQAAFLADLGAASALSEYHSQWDQLSVPAKSQLLTGLRIFIDTCPDCGGEPEFNTETVESCCSTHEVAAVACQDCDARLFETPV